MTRRSVLFTPGDRREMLTVAAETDADVLVFDLEDGVLPEQTPAARETVVDLLADPAFDPAAEVFVRVNSVHRSRREAPDREAASHLGAATGTAHAPDRAGPRAADDVAALAPVAGEIDGLVQPKVASGLDVRRLGGHCRRHGLPRRVLAVVESARGVLAAPEIATAGATDGLVFGAEDLAADVGATRSDEGWEASYARQRVVTAASAHGVDAVDTLWTDYRDEDGLRADAASAVALGFDGKLAVHPDQVEPINEAFTPDDDERAWAVRVLTARDDAAADGRATFAVDGEMVDAPLIAQAERIAARARAAGHDVDRTDPSGDG